MRITTNERRHVIPEIGCHSYYFHGWSVFKEYLVWCWYLVLQTELYIACLPLLFCYKHLTQNVVSNTVQNSYLITIIRLIVGK
jgi:hypothetical protein